MNTGNTLRALQEAELTKEQAFADDYPYGISTCLRMMGNITLRAGETGQHWILPTITGIHTGEAP